MVMPAAVKIAHLFPRVQSPSGEGWPPHDFPKMVCSVIGLQTNC